jgi:hypothetical protein
MTKEYVATECQKGMPKDIQTAPSTNCWIPKNTGMLANGIDHFERDWWREKTPAARRTVPDAKLATGEKHMGWKRNEIIASVGVPLYAESGIPRIGYRIEFPFDNGYID